MVRIIRWLGAKELPIFARAAVLSAVILLIFIGFSGCIDSNSSANRIPVPRITLSNTYPNRGEFFEFSGLSSTDEDGKIVTYSWDFGDGTTTNEPEGVYKYSEHGTYDITLIITDNGEAKSITNATIKVNAPPTSKIGVEKTTAKVYEPLQFYGGDSQDLDGTITRYEWDFGDGSVSTTKDPVHTFNEVGFYDIVLTVYDSRESSHTSKRSVDIFPRSYMVTWVKDNNSQNFNDLTMEGATTNKTYSLTQVNLLKVEVVLEWDDDFPFTIIENESTPDPDTIDLFVESAEGKHKQKNSTSGRITLSFIIGTMPKPFQVTAKDEVEAGVLAGERQPERSDETGAWLMSVTAQDCPGSLTKNGVLEIDPGNSWRMTFNFFYYEMVVTEE